MATRLGGYRRLGDRSYLTPTGERISYRQYRNRLTAAGQVKPLDVARLANQRRKQRQYNSDIQRITDAKKRVIHNEIENARAAGRMNEAEQAERRLRRIKREVIESGTRAEAMQMLRAHAHKPTEFDKEQTKLALTLLGRREGIPDWVPVGGSDSWRQGRFKHAA